MQNQAIENSAEKPIFSKKALVRLIVPLIIEQFLLLSVGMADTLMVTTAGEAAVSGVSLVDNINMLLIQIFAALSTGAAAKKMRHKDRQSSLCTPPRCFQP